MQFWSGQIMPPKGCGAAIHGLDADNPLGLGASENSRAVPAYIQLKRDGVVGGGIVRKINMKTRTPTHNRQPNFDCDEGRAHRRGRASPALRKSLPLARKNQMPRAELVDHHDMGGLANGYNASALLGPACDPHDWEGAKPRTQPNPTLNLSSNRCRGVNKQGLCGEGAKTKTPAAKQQTRPQPTG